MTTWAEAIKATSNLSKKNQSPYNVQTASFIDMSDIIVGCEVIWDIFCSETILHLGDANRFLITPTELLEHLQCIPAETETEEEQFAILYGRLEEIAHAYVDIYIDLEN